MDRTGLLQPIQTWLLLAGWVCALLWMRHKACCSSTKDCCTSLSPPVRALHLLEQVGALLAGGEEGQGESKMRVGSPPKQIGIMGSGVWRADQAQQGSRNSSHRYRHILSPCWAWNPGIGWLGFDFCLNWADPWHFSSDLPKPIGRCCHQHTKQKMSLLC